MGNKDIISKQVLRQLAVDIANRLLNLEVDTQAVDVLESEFQRIESRHADLVVRLKEAKTKKPFILHLEIQNNNDNTMPLRMLRYLTDIQLNYKDDDIRQYVLYIGASRLRMKSSINTKYLNYHYHLLDIHTVDCRILLEQDTPDALVLAILCDFKEHSPSEVVLYITRRLRELLQADEQAFRNYFAMLEILSDNRNLKTEFKEAKTMLTQVNIEQLPSFHWGLEEGMEKGITKERIRLATQLLDILEDNMIAEKTGLTIEKVEELRHLKTTNKSA